MHTKYVNIAEIFQNWSRSRLTFVIKLGQFTLVHLKFTNSMKMPFSYKMHIKRSNTNKKQVILTFWANWDSSAYIKTQRIGGTPKAGTATFISGKQDMTENVNSTEILSLQLYGQIHEIGPRGITESSTLTKVQRCRVVTTFGTTTTTAIQLVWFTGFTWLTFPLTAIVV